MLSIAAGALLVAISINALLIPQGFLTGGVSGLALALFYLFKLPVFATLLLLNIPVFWWGYREISRPFLFYSLCGTLALTLLLPLTQGLIPPLDVDRVLAAIFGGALSGAGLGLVFLGQGSTGGTDIIAVILKKKKNLGIGEVGFYSNLAVIGLSLFLFPLNTGLYTLLAMFMSGKMTDMVLTGLNTNKSVMIVSTKSGAIGNRIIHEIHRGVTYFKGTGAFTGEEKAVVNCVVNRFELARLKSIVAETDPQAFVYISDAGEVLGKGFRKRGV
ncbi:MAG: YitT family protein [Firmicutes bacterium]|nr:YitT family protein [Bacillota bacterium]